METPIDWDNLVEDLGPRLFRYFSIRFDTGQADDLTQETLIRLVRKTRSDYFDDKKGSLQMLAYGIAHFVSLEKKQEQNDSGRERIFQILRFNERDSDASELFSVEDFADQKPDAEKALIDQSQSALLRKLIGGLSPVEQEVIALSIDQEMTMEAIAETLKMPVGTVKSHYHRAKNKLTHSVLEMREL